MESTEPAEFQSPSENALVWIEDIPLPPPYDNFYLSSMTEADFPALIDMFNNTDLSHILLSPPFPYTINDARWFCDNVASKAVPGYANTHEVWVIRSKIHGGLMAGAVGSHPAQTALSMRESLHEDKSAISVGYFLSPAFRGQGIAPMALKEVMKRFPGAKFEADAEVGNISSHRVLEKTGFTRVEGHEDQVEWPQSKGGDVRALWKFVRDWKLDLYTS